ncbi:MAG: T9SS type A sorting domain-containing protein, partial [Saprospiraceae bacterium]|nr:T9SS type A sorting domain-containing protein [Saprospiraceae bacterium]
PLILIIFLSTTAFSQHYSKYTNHWYFLRNAGLDFSNFSPVNDTNGAINHSDMGFSSIMSDYYGNLLFYSDGYHVFNKNHQQMPNGFGLKGGFIQSSVLHVGMPNIILPKPGDSTLYYHFVSGQNTDTIAYYSIISLSADTGKGDVILKNIPFMSSSTAKMGVVKHSNGECYWLILHKRYSNAFCAYSFCGNTVDSIIPVISNIGQIYTNYEKSKGIISISPDGKKLAVTSYFLNYLIDTIRLELFDFNSTTGVISNQLIIPKENYDDYAYTAFSPDSKKLYVANFYAGNSAIYQFNLDAGSDSAIISSKTIIEYSTSGRNFGYMQLGLDGKIYVERHYNSNPVNDQYVGVINNPNALGTACNYNDNGVFLGNGHIGNGLPYFVSSYLLPPIEFNYTNVCLGDSVNFTLSDSVSTVFWDFGDTANINTNYSSLYAPKHLFSTPGSYTVKAMCLHYGMRDTAIQIINIYALPTVNLGQDTTINDSTILVLDAGANHSSYQWSTGDTTQTITLNGANLGVNTYQIFVDIIDTNGCTASDTILLIKGTAGINEVVQNSKISIFPNPTKGIFKIITYGINKDFNISVYNIQGQKIHSQVVHKKIVELDLSTYPKGVYFVRMWNEEFVRVGKVVLE